MNQLIQIENNKFHELNIIAVVLAAGQGKRMRSSLPKVAHILGDKPLLQWTIDSLNDSGVKQIVCVISSNPLISEIIEKFNPNKTIHKCYQENPLGTGNAVKSALNYIDNSEIVSSKIPNILLVAYGDTPAVKPETYRNFLQYHIAEKNMASVIAFTTNNPFGYGRILFSKDKSSFLGIKEEKDCDEIERKIGICNSGIICIDLNILRVVLPLLTNNNASSEYYLTDIFEIASSLKFKIGCMLADSEHEFFGINTPEQLEKIKNYLNIK